MRDQVTLAPSFSEFVRLAQKGNLVPVFSEFVADTETPVLAALKLGVERNGFLLESVEGQEKWATYSFLGVRPKAIFSCKGQKIEIIQGKKVRRRVVKGNPLRYLEHLLGQYKPVRVRGVPRFHGGAVGYMGYDCIRFFEPRLLTTRKSDPAFPDAFFFITDTLVVFNNRRHRIQIIVNVSIPKKKTKTKLMRIYERARREIETLRRQLTSPWQATSPVGIKTTIPQGVMPKKTYLANVEKAKRYVRKGDIIQVVLSNRLKGKTTCPPFQIYRAMRLINPSPYMVYFRFREDREDYAIVGSSPETLVRLEEGVIHVRPIAGTRPRGKTEREDQALERDLLADPKERAEHVMLVDLGRNDVGRVAVGGSVKVTELMKVERYSHVMHLVSHVKGVVKEGVSALEVLAASFPAGTLTGAPKVRAMEIIDELERERRGPYGGALGYISFSGNMDFCITIRTLFLKGEEYMLQAGAGIVADSRPEAEWEECQNKAKVGFRALRLAKDL